MDDFAAAGRMADVYRVLKVEMQRHSGEVVGIVIHVMAIADLRGTPMPAPIMGDHAIALTKE